ncbi:conserved hypothetical protein [gamma proteobacterium HdN1]|nr:conserved hypothetical protein [gamma proteobacterium HdN1]
MRIRMLALLSCLMVGGHAYADDGVVERELRIKDGRFYPEVVTVPAGKRIRLVVINEGPGPEEFESTQLRKETVLAEGVKRNVIIAPLKPGEYPFFGEFHMDTANGILKAE